MLTPTQIHTLLHSHGSLTARLETIAGQPLRVQVLYQGYKSLTHTQKQALGLPLAKPCVGWVREVALFGNDDAAWVRAVSVFPLATLTGQGRRFRSLGTTPIGYVLFAKKTPIGSQRTIDGNARQTVYEWQGRKILIVERFL